MQRRALLATAGCTLTGLASGCLTEPTGPAEAKIDFVELENHRRDSEHQFHVRIERGGDTVFEKTRRLAPAGSGNSTAVFENPVAGMGSYELHVSTDEYSVSRKTSALVTEERTCLGLTVYLGANTLHLEHTAYDECD